MQLKDQTFMNCLKDDQSTRRWLANLLKNLEAPPGGLPLGNLMKMLFSNISPWAAWAIRTTIEPRLDKDLV